MRNLRVQEDVLAWVQATPKPGQATRTPGFLSGAAKGPSGLYPGSVPPKAEDATNLHILRPWDSCWWGVGGAWAWCPYLHAQAPCHGLGAGMGGGGGLPAGGQLSWHRHIQVQNSKESKNSKFETGFSCC